MPLYEYRAYDSQGKSAVGLIDAPSKGEAYKRVKVQGLFPAFVDEEKGARSGRPAGDLLTFALLQLSSLLEAGLPLPAALGALESQVDNVGLRRSLTRIKVRIEEGDSFAGALALEKEFPALLVR